MQTISDHLKYITDYRDGLLDFLKTRMENWVNGPIPEKNIDFKDYPIYLVEPTKILKFLAEIQLCNKYINYLTAWHLHYVGPCIPYDNREVIKSIEKLCYSTVKPTHWNKYKEAPSIK